MTRLGELARKIRSKNAGPFWITIDIFFKNTQDYHSYAQDEAFSPAVLAEALGVASDWMKVIRIENLAAIKVSYPRPQSQGWQGERDMHAGQQFVSLLDLALTSSGQ